MYMKSQNFLKYLQNLTYTQRGDCQSIIVFFSIVAFEQQTQLMSEA